MRLPNSLLTVITLFAASSLAQDRTPGCGKSVNFAGSARTFNITSSGVQRNFLVYVPKTYDGTKPWATTFGFHGSGGIGLFFEADTKFDGYKVGKDGDYLLVYPSALGDGWASGLLEPPPGNDTGAPTTPLDQDLKFVSDLLDYMRESYCIDNEHVYATGISNGGGFVNRLACSPTVGSNFAAFAPVVGAFTGFEAGGNETCEPYKSPLPIVSISGGNDTTVPYYGRNVTITTLPIPTWLDQWATRNRCEDPKEETINGTVHKWTWRCDGVDGAMVHYKEDDMGHLWPSREPNFSQTMDGSGPTQIEGNAVIIEFFAQFNQSEKGENGSPDLGGSGGSPTESQTGGPGPTETPNAAGVVDSNFALIVLALAVAVVGGFGW